MGVTRSIWSVSVLQERTIGKVILVAYFSVLSSSVPVQGQLQTRVPVLIDSQQRITLAGSAHPLAKAEYDLGRLSRNTEISGITMQFLVSDIQKSQLQTLLDEQQDKSSPVYHRWLTPTEYGDRFGLTQADVERIANWLQSKGFKIENVSPTRTSIRFRGTVAEIEDVFGTEMHQYHVNGERHIANSTPISIPATLGSVILSVRNLSDVRPLPKHVRRAAAWDASPHFTSNISGSHYLAPDDIATIYNVKPLYQDGYDGTGEKIAVVGQTQISVTDIEAFRAASRLPAKDPILVLVPDTGSPANNNSSDEEESDLDLEWSGAIAKNATVYFVYTGNNPNATVFDSLHYAIETNIAPVISLSYGGCEADFSAGDVATLQAWFQQATAQGQGIIVAAGDTGAADCDYSSGASAVTTATHGLTVDFPASSPWVTGIGGTEFNEGSSGYWNSTNNSNNGSAISYMPEQVWNETSSSIANGGSLAAGGGGKSSLFPKPSWQNAPGVPDDGVRDVPDLSLDAADFHDGYLFCTQGSCTNGFRNSQNYLTVGGGTSFGAPIFAGILALVDQKLGGSGQGNINASLYQFASSVSNVFHDIITGNNQVPCTAGSKDCGSSGNIGFNASAGYDLASGLGSVDAFNLATALSGGSGPSLATTTTTVSASLPSVPSGSSISLTAKVKSATNGAITGTVTFALGSTAIGTAEISVGVASINVTASSANGLSVGTHTVTATYSGDSNFRTSSGTIEITVTQPQIVVSGTSMTLPAGGSGTSTITVASIGGYAGTTKLSVSAQAGVIDSYTFSPDSLTLTVGTSGTTTLTIRSSQTALLQAPASPLNGMTSLMSFGLLAGVWIVPTNLYSRKLLPLMRQFLATLFLVAVTGCGGGQRSPRSYQVTVTATDSSNPNLHGSATFTITVN